MSTPVAVFAFNRPAHVARTLASLERCAGLTQITLHCYCDGSRSPQEEAAVAQTREVVRAWAERHPARIVERERNLGLFGSVVSGVSELCEQYGRCIIIEDDLTVSPDFLDYMRVALDRYEDETNVFQISGFMFPVQHPARPDAFFLPLTTTWGWATWQRAWTSFEAGADDAHARLADPETRRRFDLDDSYPYSAMLEQRLANGNDSWGILWWWSVFRAGGLVLHPRRSLVRNEGFDASGTHCTTDSTNFPEMEIGLQSSEPARPLEWPAQITTDLAALARIKAYLAAEHRPSLAGRLRRSVRRYLGRGAWSHVA